MDNFPDLFLEKLELAHYYPAGYVVALCIFHPDTRPSLFIYPDKYHCASCGKWGNTSDLAKRLDDLHFVYHEPQPYGFNPFTRWLKDHSLYNIMNVASKNAPIKYLEDRGISKEIQRKLGIGLLDNWITFPINGITNSLIGAVARAGEGNNSRSKYMLPYQQNPDLLYVPSWERIEKQDIIYVTFGIIDSITLYAAGFASASTTTGKRINPSALDNLRKEIKIIPDEGEQPEAFRLAAKLGWRGKVVQLPYPDGCKDVNDLVWKAKFSLDKVRKIINE